MATGNTFWDRLMYLAGYVKQDSVKVNQIKAPAWALAGLDAYSDYPDLSVTGNQLTTMQAVSWVYTATTARVHTAAGTPFSVKLRVKEEQKDIDNHPFEVLLEKPNPMQSRFEFLTAWFGYRLLAGNCYTWLNRTSPDAPPTEMWHIPPQMIRPVPDKQLYIRGYEYDPGNGQTILLDTWEVCHTKTWHPTNRFVGLSAIEAIALVVDSDLSMQRWNRNYFSRKHAKPAGALAFADPINDPDWERLQHETEKEHGGAERRMMMLRGAGKGGVQWLQFGISQKDMEFLAGRTFSKEEIFSALAPGLASVLAVNATEANALNGNKTFMQLAIWPDHQAIAERITTDILPAYGDNLRGEFDEVRISDRALELQEQEAFAKVHTIDEVRKEFYDDDPVGDERGELLVPELNKPSGIGPSEKETAPIPPQLQAFAGQQEEAKPEEKNKKEADVDTEDDEDEAAAKAELLRWQRKATKRLKAGNSPLCDFESDIIGDGLKCAVLHGLEHSETTEEIREVFDRAIKARRTSNAPDDAQRRRAERELQALMEEFFAGQVKRIKKAVRSGA